MKCDEWVTWFFIWIMWFIVFSLICGWEREVCIEDVSGLNDDLFLNDKACCSNQQGLSGIDECVKEMRTSCMYARAKRGE